MRITKRNIHNFETVAAKLTGGYYVLPRKKVSKSIAIAERNAMSRFISEHKAISKKTQ